MRGPAISVEFFLAVKRIIGGDEKRSEALALSRHLLYDVAQAIGKSDSESFRKKMNLQDPMVHLAAGTIHFSFAGWGFVEISAESTPAPNGDDYYLIYDHPFSFEADSYLRAEQKVDVPICAMNAGYSAGWCSVAFSVETCATEILCKARGDPHCRFIMAHPSKVRSGLNKTNERRSPQTTTGARTRGEVQDRAPRVRRLRGEFHARIHFEQEGERRTRPVRRENRCGNAAEGDRTRARERSGMPDSGQVVRMSAQSARDHNRERKYD